MVRQIGRTPVMAKQIQQVWQPLLNNSIEVGDKILSGENFLFPLELEKTLKSLSITPATINIVGLSNRGLANQGIRRFFLLTEQEPTLQEWVAIATPLAYLESLHELLKKTNLLQQIAPTFAAPEIDKEVKKLAEFQLQEKEAKEALCSFPDSELAKLFKDLFSHYLQQIGIQQVAANIITAWAAWQGRRYLKLALAEGGDGVKNLTELYVAERTKNLDRCDRLTNYLKTEIATKPQEKVFTEEFAFKDIYIPLEAEVLEKNGLSSNSSHSIDLEYWGRRTLLDEGQGDQVMFVEGGPGRGKNVFCRMFADWVRQNLHPLWTPVLIRLRDLEKYQDSFADTLLAGIKADFAHQDPDWLINPETRFLFLLDGFDELRLEGTASGGLEKFLKELGKFQKECHQQPHMGHRFLVAGRPLALQGIEKFLPPNLKRVRILPLDESLQYKWLSKWALQTNQNKTEDFQNFLSNPRCPQQVKELAQEPLLLYLLAAMHRDGKLKVEDFAVISSTRAKILIYEQSLAWVLSRQHSNWLHQDIQGLRRILSESALCIIQSGGESACWLTIEERIKADDGAFELVWQATEQQKPSTLKNALTSFYLQPAEDDKVNSVEFTHKSFGEFLYADRLKESLEDWTRPGIKRQQFYVSQEQLNWEIYDLLGYGGLTPEIVEYLGELLAASKDFYPVKLFHRLNKFYTHWFKGKFIDGPPENFPQKKRRELKEQGIEIGQRQIDVYAGLNVIILLLELNRCLQKQRNSETKIAFYPCGKKGTEDFDRFRLLRIISYSHCVEVGAFLKIVMAKSFLPGVNLDHANLSNVYCRNADLSKVSLSNAYLRNANLNQAILREANLSYGFLGGVDLSGANLEGANLSNADLRGANLADISWDERTNWRGVRGLREAVNVPLMLLGMGV